MLPPLCKLCRGWGALIHKDAEGHATRETCPRCKGSGDEPDEEELKLRENQSNPWLNKLHEHY